MGDAVGGTGGDTMIGDGRNTFCASVEKRTGAFFALTAYLWGVRVGGIFRKKGGGWNGLWIGYWGRVCVALGNE